MSCALSALSGWALEWDDQDYTHNLKGSCINLKPYMLLNMKKHTLITKEKKKGVKLEFIFPEENLCQGKNINSVSTKVHILILLCVAINLVANLVVGGFVSSLKW